MSESLTRYFKWIVLSVITLLTYFITYYQINPELVYHNQQPAFLSSGFFFNHFTSLPGGLSEYFSLFFTQFFISQLWGSIVLTALVSLFFCLLSLLSSKIFNNSFVQTVTAIIPTSLLIILFHDYNFQYVLIIKYILLLLFSIAIVKIITKWWSSVVYLISGFLIYYLSGSGPFIIFSAIVFLLILFSNSSVVKKLPLLIITPIFALFYPLFAYEHFYNIAPDEKYLNFLEQVPLMLLYKPNVLFYVFIFSIPGIFVIAKLTDLILIKFQKSDSAKSSKIIFISFASLPLILAGITYYVFTSSINKLEQTKIKVDYLNYHERWQEAEETAFTYEKYDMFINLYYNRAIDNQGLLVNNLFNYPQYIGDEAMFPDKIMSGQQSMYYSDFYFDIGYISEAQHWAYEAQTMLPYSPRILKRLVVTNIISRKYKGAQKFLDILKLNPVTSEWTEKYQNYINDTLSITKDSLLVLKRKNMPEDNVVYGSIISRYKDLLKKDSTNIKAYQHLQVYFLLGRKLGDFMQTYDEMNSLFYKQSPRLFEEAVLLYLVKSQKHDLAKYNISLETQKKFSDYHDLLKQFKNNKKEAKGTLSEYFSNSYMFYIMYNNPAVTKAKIETREVEY